MTFRYEPLMKDVHAERTRFAVLGCGHGGQAMAGYLAAKGFEVSLYNRDESKISAILYRGGIELEGLFKGFGVPKCVTSSLQEALADVDVVMVAVPASAHKDLAAASAPHLTHGQIIVLNPGRTGGALEFAQVLRREGCKSKVTVAEAQTFIYASRRTGPARSRIFGIKNRVPVAALPATRTMAVVKILRKAYPQFVPAGSVLETSFSNIGAIFHPVPTILNAARIESGESFEHYREGITPSVARVLEVLDSERLAVAMAYGIVVESATEWLRSAYGVNGSNLYEAIHANPGYRGILAPDSLNCRYIYEDVPTGLVPLASMGERAGVPTPMLKNMVDLACNLTGTDFWAHGRSTKAMGIDGLGPKEVVDMVLSEEVLP